jgi:hypothetical protein
VPHAPKLSEVRTEGRGVTRGLRAAVRPLPSVLTPLTRGLTAAPAAAAAAMSKTRTPAAIRASSNDAHACRVASAVTSRTPGMEEEDMRR